MYIEGNKQGLTEINFKDLKLRFNSLGIKVDIQRKNENTVTIKFKNHPYTGIVLLLKSELNEGVVNFKYSFHVFNPLVITLSVLGLFIFGYLIIQSTLNEVILFIILSGILTFSNWIKFKRQSKELTKILFPPN